MDINVYYINGINISILYMNIHLLMDMKWNIYNQQRLGISWDVRADIHGIVIQRLTPYMYAATLTLRRV